MILRERRRHFFINKSLQLRYMLTLSLVLISVTAVSLVGLYFGIWGEVLGSFSNEKILNDLVTAARLQQYEEARTVPAVTDQSFNTLSLFRQAERLSDRQREIFKEIIDRAHSRLIEKLFFLFLCIALGSLFLSHKIAGPLYRFETVLYQMALGDLRVRCRLRKFDEAKSVSQAFNRTLDSLDYKISQLKRIVREKDKDPASLLPRLKQELSEFKTSADR